MLPLLSPKDRTALSLFKPIPHIRSQVKRDIEVTFQWAFTYQKKSYQEEEVGKHLCLGMIAGYYLMLITIRLCVHMFATVSSMSSIVYMLQKFELSEENK